MKRDGRVSLTLSDSFCVARHREEFLDLVESQVDVLFANEAEITELYQVESFDDALQKVRHHCEIAALTRSAKGSVIVAGDEVHVIDAHPTHVVDTTGAGDQYAAGFLYGLTHDMPLDDVREARLEGCGRGDQPLRTSPRDHVVHALVVTDDLVAAATRWLEEDPDPDTRTELAALLAANDEAALADRFGARLQFGTAGLRGALGAGPNRMNRVIVRRARGGAWLGICSTACPEQRRGGRGHRLRRAPQVRRVRGGQRRGARGRRDCARCCCRRACRRRCSRSRCVISAAPLA